MSRIIIEGGCPLRGVVYIQGSKNAVLPILAGALLHKGTTVLHHCPHISDVMDMLKIMEEAGCLIAWHGHTLILNTYHINCTMVSRALAGKMRSSIILMGSLLGRQKKAEIPYPGGCTIGARPIDLHLKALKAMGASIEEAEGVLSASCRELKGAHIEFPIPSVGATENTILAAVLAKGTTRLSGAAMEPEIIELCRFLKEKGACIQGEGSSVITITGVESLRDSEYTICGDRIVAGTYLYAALATKGEVILRGVPSWQMKTPLKVAVRLGAEVEESEEGIRVKAPDVIRAIPVLRTEPYPGFPTDLQSQLLVLLALAEGESVLEEHIFEARFHMAEQLKRLGADIHISGNTARIHGGGRLKGTFVKAEDLRGGAALVIAALAADGQTVIEDTGYIDRGYENICSDLQSLGADIAMEA